MTPSAGGIYPLRIMVAVRSVNGLDSGVYKTCYDTGATTLIRENDTLGKPIESLFMSRKANLSGAAAIIFLVAECDEVSHVYGLRGYRYLLLEAGALSQNLHLKCTELQVPFLLIGAYDDIGVLSYLGLESSIDKIALVAAAIGSG